MLLRVIDAGLDSLLSRFCASISHLLIESDLSERISYLSYIDNDLIEIKGVSLCALK